MRELAGHTRVTVSNMVACWKDALFLLWSIVLDSYPKAVREYVQLMADASEYEEVFVPNYFDSSNSNQGPYNMEIR